MSFYKKTQDGLTQELLAEFALAIGADKISSASEIAVKAKIYASKFEGIYYNQEYILNQAFPQTADEENLPKHGYIWNTDRKMPTPAVGPVILGRTTAYASNIVIPKDTIISTDPNAFGKLVISKTQQEVTLIAGQLEVSVNVKTDITGYEANLPAGSLTVINNPPTGLEFVRQEVDLSDGTDIEDLEVYRQRVLLRRRKPPRGGTFTDYELWALDVPGVTVAKAFPVPRGNNTVDVLIATASGIPSDELVTTVLNYILSKRPMLADVHVLKPTPKSINVTVSIKPKAGFSFATLQPLAISAIEQYISTLEIGTEVLISGIIDKVKDINGVYDVSVSVPSGNVDLLSTEMAEVGVINVNEL